MAPKIALNFPASQLLAWIIGLCHHAYSFLILILTKYIENIESWLSCLMFRGLHAKSVFLSVACASGVIVSKAPQPEVWKFS